MIMHLLSIAILIICSIASPGAAQEVTLRAVSSFAEGTEFSKNFERFIEKVNSDGKGIIKINYIGGPRAVPPFEVGNAVRSRVVDMANVTGAFYTNLMPEADGFKLNGRPMSEQRSNGTWEFINRLHNEKLNAIELGRELKANEGGKTIPLLGFFSHVQTDLQRAALEAGYDQVIPRSVFSRDLAKILAG